MGRALGNEEIIAGQSELDVVFIVSDQLALTSLGLLHSFLRNDVSLQPKSILPLPDNVTAEIIDAKTAPLEKQGGNLALVVLLEITNKGSLPFRVDHGDFRVGAPAKADPRAFYWDSFWPIMKELSPGGEEAGSGLSIATGPGETRRIQTHQEVGEDFSLENTKLGFFQEVSVPLGPVQ